MYVNTSFKRLLPIRAARLPSSIYIIIDNATANASFCKIAIYAVSCSPSCQTFPFISLYLSLVLTHYPFIVFFIMIFSMPNRSLVHLNLVRKI